MQQKVVNAGVYICSTYCNLSHYMKQVRLQINPHYPYTCASKNATATIIAKIHAIDRIVSSKMLWLDTSPQIDMQWRISKSNTYMSKALL